MSQVLIIQVSPDELKDLIRDTIENSFKQRGSINEVAVEQPTLMKIEEACEFLKVSKVTIHKWKRNGRIPFHRISNRIFFKRTELLDALRKISGGKGGASC
jgi:excisionase family DNA binding protein